jgi:tripartite-type tricarboxylate transporter receptor subunit TctC
MLENEAYEFPGAGKVPSAADTFPEVKKYYPLDQWLGFMLPADTPKPVLQKIEKVFQNAVKSGEVKKLADDSLHKVYALSGKSAKDMAVKAEAKYSWLLQEWGMAKVNPEKLGIQKP